MNADNGILDVAVTADADPSIENLHVSYVIWKGDIGFDAKTFSLSENINADYRLIGITSFKNSIDLSEGLGFLSNRLACVGGNCKGDCTTI